MIGGGGAQRTNRALEKKEKSRRGHGQVVRLYRSQGNVAFHGGKQQRVKTARQDPGLTTGEAPRRLTGLD